MAMKMSSPRLANINVNMNPSSSPTPRSILSPGPSIGTLRGSPSASSNDHSGNNFLRRTNSNSSTERNDCSAVPSVVAPVPTPPNMQPPAALLGMDSAQLHKQQHNLKPDAPACSPVGSAQMWNFSLCKPDSPFEMVAGTRSPEAHSQPASNVAPPSMGLPQSACVITSVDVEDPILLQQIERQHSGLQIKRQHSGLLAQSPPNYGCFPDYLAPPGNGHISNPSSAGSSPTMQQGRPNVSALVRPNVLPPTVLQMPVSGQILPPMQQSPQFIAPWSTFPLNVRTTAASPSWKLKKKRVRKDVLRFEEIEFGPMIGQGSFGKVYKAKLWGMEVAVKTLRTKGLFEDAKELKGFKKEVRIMRNLRHPNILEFLGVCLEPCKMCIVTEFLAKGSVEDLLEKMEKSGKRFSTKRIVAMALDICRGLNWLHHKGIIHRDLKTGNLLIDKHGKIKLGDFGLSHVKKTHMNNTGFYGACGTACYMAPEVLKKNSYDVMADVFSFGICLCELVTGRYPYENEPESTRTFEDAIVMGLRPPIPDDCHPKLRSLIVSCWAEAPEDRPDVDTVMTQLQMIELSLNDDSAALTNAAAAARGVRASGAASAAAGKVALEEEDLEDLPEEAVKVIAEQQQHLDGLSAALADKSERLHAALARMAVLEDKLAVEMSERQRLELMHVRPKRKTSTRRSKVRRTARKSPARSAAAAASSPCSGPVQPASRKRKVMAIDTGAGVQASSRGNKATKLRSPASSKKVHDHGSSRSSGGRAAARVPLSASDHSTDDDDALPSMVRTRSGRKVVTPAARTAEGTPAKLAAVQGPTTRGRGRAKKRS